MSYLFSRIVNLLRAEGSYWLSRLGVAHVRHLPTFVSIEPAAVCQLACPECPIGVAKCSGEAVSSHAVEHTIMPMTTFECILEQVRHSAHTMQFFFQGEPLLHPQLPEMIRLAHREHLYTILSTNAQALTAELAEALMMAGTDRIIVSMDGLTQESYSAYRVGGDLEKVLSGLRFLREAKERTHAHCTIVLQMLCLKTNEQEWEAVRKCYRRLGADRLELKTAQLYDYQHGHPLMPTDERYSRYRLTQDGTYRLRHPFAGHCHRLWTGCVITTDGLVLPCCYDKSAHYAFGNILQQPLKQIFWSEKAQHFRRRVLSHRVSPLDICSNCAQ